jgi:hypothetical protein
VVDLVETRCDVGLQHPVVIDRPGGEVVDLGDRVMRASIGAEPVRARLEVRLEDGFEHCLETGLDHPVGHGRYPELAQLAAGLRDHHLPHLEGLERAGLQRGPELFQEGLDSDRGFDSSHRGPVHPRGPSAGVGGHTLPGVHQKRRLVDEVEQVTEPATGSSVAQRCNLICILRTAK